MTRLIGQKARLGYFIEKVRRAGVSVFAVQVNRKKVFFLPASIFSRKALFLSFVRATHQARRHRRHRTLFPVFTRSDHSVLAIWDYRRPTKRVHSRCTGTCVHSFTVSVCNVQSNDHLSRIVSTGRAPSLTSSELLQSFGTYLYI